MPEMKHYSYTNLRDTPKHGEIIESSYLLGEKGPRSTWTRVFEMVVLLATIGGCAYLTVFLFHNGNHHPPADDSPSGPHRPVGASSASLEDAACSNHPKCKSLIADPTAACCPTIDDEFLSCCL
ncbi:unnamed protein product [Laminaria digitata]